MGFPPGKTGKLKPARYDRATGEETKMSEKPRLDTTRLQKIAQAYWESAALMAAVELEIFTAIAHGHDSIPAAARAAGISERNAERLTHQAQVRQQIDAEGGGRYRTEVAANAHPDQGEHDRLKPGKCLGRHDAVGARAAAEIEHLPAAAEVDAAAE